MQQKSKNVILTGMMGSGKTSVGLELAKILECDFFDLDEIIEKKYGKITQIFKDKGENYFREIETSELKNFKNNGAFVLSTGGGAVLKEENLEILRSLGEVFYLSADAQTIYDRVKEQTQRPLLNTKDPKKTIEDILSSRLEKYEKSGEKIVTDNKNIEQIAREIYEKIMR